MSYVFDSIFGIFETEIFSPLDSIYEFHLQFFFHLDRITENNVWLIWFGLVVCTCVVSLSNIQQQHNWLQYQKSKTLNEKFSINFGGR